MRLRVLTCVIAVLGCSTAGAVSWTEFTDPRFGFRMEIPAEYQLSYETEQQNGRFFHTRTGDFLATWFSPASEGTFAADVRLRQEQDEANGWAISYERITPTWASYSGTKGGEIRYVRAVDICGEGAAYFVIDYPVTSKRTYDPIVTHMVRSLRPTRC
jgi:hypothetical protein